MTRFKKRHKEATTDEAPDSLGPWEMLHEDEIASISARLREDDDGGRRLTAFARRRDIGALASFDQDENGKNKGVVVLFQDGRERQFANFSAWFDAALADGR